MKYCKKCYHWKVCENYIKEVGNALHIKITVPKNETIKEPNGECEFYEDAPGSAVTSTNKQSTPCKNILCKNNNGKCGITDKCFGFIA
jgi:hypothetical protein